MPISIIGNMNFYPKCQIYVFYCIYISQSLNVLKWAFVQPPYKMLPSPTQNSQLTNKTTCFYHFLSVSLNGNMILPVIQVIFLEASLTLLFLSHLMSDLLAIPIGFKVFPELRPFFYHLHCYNLSLNHHHIAPGSLRLVFMPLALSIPLQSQHSSRA